MPSKMLNILVTSPKYMIPLFPQKRFNRIKINLSMPNRGQNLLKLRVGRQIRAMKMLS